MLEVQHAQIPDHRIDRGTRQWSPQEEIAFAKVVLQRQLQARRARRSAAVADGAVSSGAGPNAQPQASVTLSYRDLLKALSIAAAEQRGVKLTATAGNIYLTLVDVHDAAGVASDLAEVTKLETGLRNRLEHSVARRCLESLGPDFVVGEEIDYDSAVSPTERQGM